MGTYSNRSTRPKDTATVRTWIERIQYVGYAIERTVTASEWTEVDRTDCYCCSCPEGEFGTLIGKDSCCRNHGWDGERPCEEHNLLGSVDSDGVMPATVQATRASYAKGSVR
jgi:hypothetical protein